MGVLFAVFGLVFALFAIVALFVGAHLAWIYGHVVLALACFAYALGTSFAALRELLAGDSARRSARYGGNAAVQVIALAVILGVAAYFSKQYPVNWDWTEAKLHSLTEASKSVLAQIPAERPVEILAFYLPGSDEGAKDALDLYTYASDRVKVRIVDPNAHPQLATRFQVTANGVLVVCGGPCESAAGTARVTEPSEQELTKAIRSVLSGKKKVYYLAGHGEADPGNTEATGASSAKQALEGENLEVATLVLANQENVPDDAGAVIVAGPDRTLFARELQALDRYVRGGGSLLVMADPIVESGLEDTVRGWGIALGKDLIVDQQIQLFAGPQVGIEPVVLSYGSHPITEKLRGQITTFYLARSLAAAESGNGSVELASTGEQSWAESDVERFVRESTVGRDDADRKGPIPIAMARTFAVEGAEKKREGRLIVVGDSDFSRNRYITSAANADLLLNMVNWLVGEEHFISIERKLPRASSVALTNEQFYNFRYLSLFVLPEALLLGGILVWWRRRSEDR
jgi:ABC-type uncharacterized transport system involved in gliding motility auxiliary subunit